jgi:hypothetical protein
MMLQESVTQFPFRKKVALLFDCRDVSELVDHFKDPKERVEKWRAEKDRAEERIAALKVRKEFLRSEAV